MDSDAQLLRCYAEEGAQTAFAELARRNVDLVYAAALRQTGGDTHLAQDVTQGVFLALASQASALQRHTSLTGWLFTTTRFLTAKAVRTQSRWQRREQEANTMMLAEKSGPAWSELRPVIDEAMHTLGEVDRAAILSRFFEGKSFAEVAAACGARSDNAARMRVDRALEKLRRRLLRFGITSTTAALGAALAAQPVIAAPAGLAALVATVPPLTGAVGAAGWIFMGTKLKVAAVGVVLVIGAGTWWITQQHFAAALVAADQRGADQARALVALREENRRLAENARRATEPKPASLPSPPPTEAGAAAEAAANLKRLTQWHQRGLIRTGLNLVEVEGNFQQPWAELFNLTPAENAALLRATETARREIGELELARTTVRREPEGRLVITIPPFPEGAAVYDRLVQQYASTLGPERYAAFATLGLEEVENSMRLLGVGQTTLTVTHDPSRGTDRAWSLASRVDRPNGTTKQAAGTGKAVVDHLLGPLTRLVPPDL